MAVTIVPTPSVPTATVSLAVAGAGATVRVWRSVSSGVRTELRGSPFPTVAGAVTILDREAPFGVLLTYDVGAAQLATTTLDVTVPWISTAVAPFPGVPVEIQADDGWEYPARLSAFDVIGRALPVVTWSTRAGRSGVLSIVFRTTGARADIGQVFADGSPVLMRYPAACYPSMLGGWYGVQSVRVLPSLPGADSGTVEASYVLTDRPGDSLPTLDPNWTWADVPANSATWLDVLATYSSWRTLVTHAPTGYADAVRFAS